MRKARERSPSTDDSRGLCVADPGLLLEARLILLSAGGDATSPMLQALARQKINWRLLCGLAEREQASSVLWARLSRLGCVADPDSTTLHRLAMVSEFSLLRLQRRLYETIDALAAAGIDAVLLKGAAVAHTAYASFVERPMRDIDLLVAPEHVDAAQEILLVSGWTKSRHSPPEVYEGHQHLPPYGDTRGSGAQLELHTDLFFQGHPFRFSPSVVRGRAQRFQVDGHVLLVPDPLHQLFHACLHFAYGHMMSLSAWRTFRDVAALGDSRTIDWKEFVSLARESGGATACYWTLKLAQTTAGVTAPTQVLDDLCPALPGAALRILERHFTLGLLPTDSSCPSVRLRNLMWRVGVFPGVWRLSPVRPWGRLTHIRKNRSAPGRRSKLGWASRHLRHAVASPRYIWNLFRVPAETA